VIQGNVHDYYKLLLELGSGAMGIVHKSSNKQTKTMRAIKSILKKELSTEDTDRMFLEFETVRQLDHPNIIKIYEVIEDHKKFHIVTELYTGGELFERMVKEEKLTENIAAKYMHQILSTIMY
jgi:calcium-dependent protein kinase